jgi:hypothetical protein
MKSLNKKYQLYEILALHDGKDLLIMTLLSGRGYQYFKGTCCLHLHKPEDGS